MYWQHSCSGQHASYQHCLPGVHSLLRRRFGQHSQFALKLLHWRSTASVLISSHNASLPAQGHQPACQVVQSLVRLSLCIWRRLCQSVADFRNLSKEERTEKKYLGSVKRLPLPEALALDAACLAACASNIARRLMENQLHTFHPSKARRVMLHCRAAIFLTLCSHCS